jgi:hypothetical protein
VRATGWSAVIIGALAILLSLTWSQSTDCAPGIEFCAIEPIQVFWFGVIVLGVGLVLGLAARRRT